MHRPDNSFMQKQDPGGVALLAALFCFIFAIFQGVTAFQTGNIPAELILLVVLTFVFLAAWWVAKKI
jgi:type III secretory pathway component EscS